MSVSMETELASKITRIKWLNSEIMSEMQISGLEMQAKLEYVCLFERQQGAVA